MDENQNPQPTPPQFGGSKVIQPLNPGLKPPEPKPVPDTPQPLPVSVTPPVIPTGPPMPPADDPNAEVLPGPNIRAPQTTSLKGLYVIALFSVSGLLISIFSKSHPFVIGANIFNILLVCGLLARVNLIRVISVWLLTIGMVLTIISSGSSIRAYMRAEDAYRSFEALISQHDQSTLSVAQQEQLNKIRANVSAQRRRINLAYVQSGLSSLMGVATLIYLTRPKVKAAFR